MKKQFIVLIDFSEYSANLIKYAYDWSRQHHAALLLVHQTVVVAPGLTDSENKKKITHHTNEKALEKLKTFAQELLPKAAKPSFLVSDRHLQHILSEVLTATFDNLIFVGLKGSGLLKKLFIGNFALQVIEESNNIVVAMPKEINTFSLKKIFVGVTKKHPLNLPELNKLFRFINTKDTHITFFHLVKKHEDTQAIQTYLREIATYFGQDYDTDIKIFEGKDPFTDIEKVINNKIDELLIVQKGSRLLTDRIFRRFLINHLVFKGQTPLIVLP